MKNQPGASDDEAKGRRFCLGYQKFHGDWGSTGETKPENFQKNSMATMNPGLT